MAKPRIFDAFLFFNELDVLRLRLAELDPYVDQFVLVEAPISYAGRDKPLYFETHRSEFTAWLPKLHHEVFQGAAPAIRDDEAARFELETMQRNAVWQALQSCGFDETKDILLLSDVDEIPRGSRLPRARALLKKWPVVVFIQRNYRYYINNLSAGDFNGVPWAGTVAAGGGAAAALSMQALRNGKNPLLGSRTRAWAYLEDGGWHFSFLGGPTSVAYKIQNFSHARHDRGGPRLLYDVCRSNAHNIDLRWKGGMEVSYASARAAALAPDLPRHLLEHYSEFSHLFWWDEPASGRRD
jgi:beta-1,4-mannosyl-glycoprotein beta-1,4-N-acetylglucosaminyltransferase